MRQVAELTCCVVTLFLLAKAASAQYLGASYDSAMPSGLQWYLTVGCGESDTHIGNGFYSLDWDDQIRQGGNQTEVQIVSPVSGKVLKSRNALCPNTFGTDVLSFGCYIEIDFGAGYSVKLAHLKEGSIPQGVLEKGYVSKGEMVGILGNSGYSDGSHLHQQLAHLDSGLETNQMLKDVKIGNTKMTELHRGWHDGFTERNNVRFVPSNLNPISCTYLLNDDTCGLEMGRSAGGISHLDNENVLVAQENPSYEIFSGDTVHSLAVFDIDVAHRYRVEAYREGTEDCAAENSHEEYCLDWSWNTEWREPSGESILHVTFENVRVHDDLKRIGTPERKWTRWIFRVFVDTGGGFTEYSDDPEVVFSYRVQRGPYDPGYVVNSPSIYYPNPTICTERPTPNADWFYRCNGSEYGEGNGFGVGDTVFISARVDAPQRNHRIHYIVYNLAIGDVEISGDTEWIFPSQITEGYDMWDFAFHIIELDGLPEAPYEIDMFVHTEDNRQYDIPDYVTQFRVGEETGGDCLDEEMFCDNGLDDDCDGLVDTEDPECPTPCTPRADFRCYEGDVYWYNSCEERGSLLVDCAESTCVNGRCEERGIFWHPDGSLIQTQSGLCVHEGGDSEVNCLYLLEDGCLRYIANPDNLEDPDAFDLGLNIFVSEEELRCYPLCEEYNLATETVSFQAFVRNGTLYAYYDGLSYDREVGKVNESTFEQLALSWGRDAELGGGEVWDLKRSLVEEAAYHPGFLLKHQGNYYVTLFNHEIRQLNMSQAELARAGYIVTDFVSIPSSVDRRWLGQQQSSLTIADFEDSSHCGDMPECTEASDCPEPIPGEWSECLSIENVCDENGTQSRYVPTVSCVDGSCDYSQGVTEEQNCPVETDGLECGLNRICRGGECQDTCTDDCLPQGRTQCTGELIQTCGNHDQDECLEWSSPTSCPDGVCYENSCCAPDTCISLQVECGDWPNGCGDTLECGGCGIGETCDLTGTCVTTCSDECDMIDETRCVDGIEETCGDFDPDDCLDWGNAITCTYGCSGNTCAGCTPTTCEAIGSNSCGPWPDGCGETLECGICDELAQEECQNGFCVCVPRECLVSECGTPDNGCGMSLECGDCTGVDICYEGECCTLQSCADLGHDCGTWDNGCGDEVTCPACGFNEQCVAGVCEPLGPCEDNACAIRFDPNDNGRILILPTEFDLQDGTPFENVTPCVIGWSRWADDTFNHVEIAISDTDSDGWLEYDLPEIWSGDAPYQGCINCRSYVPFRFAFRRCNDDVTIADHYLDIGSASDSRTGDFYWTDLGPDKCKETSSFAVSFDGVEYYASGARTSNQSSCLFCPEHEAGWNGVCQQDLHGAIDSNESGENAGHSDFTADQIDNDWDCYCEVAPCEPSENPHCTETLGGDCDDNPFDNIDNDPRVICEEAGGVFFIYTTNTCPANSTFWMWADGSEQNNPAMHDYELGGWDNDCDGEFDEGGDDPCTWESDGEYFKVYCDWL